MRRKLIRNKACPLCADKITLEYKDTLRLTRYLSERGKILSRAKTGACAKHQRQITRSIKRARLVALMPFTLR